MPLVHKQHELLAGEECHSRPCSELDLNQPRHESWDAPSDSWSHGHTELQPWYSCWIPIQWLRSLLADLQALKVLKMHLQRPGQYVTFHLNYI